jgi:cytochrome b
MVVSATGFDPKSYRRTGRIRQPSPVIMQGERLTDPSGATRGAPALPPTGAAIADGRPVLVWDLPVRLFHWLTAALVPAAYVTWRLNWMRWHAWVGDALLALVLFRLLWGFFGSDTARFSCFVASPRSAAQHLAHIFRREPDLEAGHNAAGSWMVMLLLALLLAQVLTGIFSDNDVADVGPFTELTPARIANLVTALHDKVLWNALLAAVGLHLFAILVYGLAKRHNLLFPMITGRKTLPDGVPAPRIATPRRALVLLAGAIAAAAAIATYL